MRSPSAFADLREFRRLALGPQAVMGDHHLYPGCRLLLFCAACTVCRDYKPEKIIDRLRALRAGGHDTPVAEIATRIGWPCPACGRQRWATQLALPAGMSERERKWLVGRSRS